jgi:hypothetical protein
MSSQWSDNDIAEFVDDFRTQAEDLCRVHDHVTRVVANLDIPADRFADFDSPEKATFDLTSIVRLFLYQHVRGFSQSSLEDRLRGVAYVYIRLRLARPPSQQAISYNWRRRFSLSERRAITQAATAIQAVCADHEVIAEGEPLIHPEKIDEIEIADDLVVDAIERARTRGLAEFDTKRAANTTYDDMVFFERQAFLNLADAGTTTTSVTDTRRFERASDREKTPHGDTHLGTMKKTARPPEQTRLDDYADGCRPSDWKRIRDEVLAPFHKGVEIILEEVKEQGGIREPVIAAIDITPWPVYTSPYKDDEDVSSRDTSVTINGRERYPKEDYPEMVHGLKDHHERGYELATITIIAEDTPIVLGVEPVRRESQWETDEVGDTSNERIVDRLLEQAEQHVAIHKVFCDREFDAAGVRDAIDRHDKTYLIPKAVYPDSQEVEDIEELEREAVTGVGVVRDVPHGYEGRVHHGSIMYIKSTERENAYAVFTTNRDVPLWRVQGFVDQYRWRWRVENEYKSIKKHFLPTVGSTDYRIRLLYFVFGVVMYNVWRLTNLLFRDAVADDVHLGDHPPVKAGEVVEIFVFCLVDPG